MTRTGEDLRQIVAGGPDVWTQRGKAALSSALERSGEEAPRHLREFCVRVQDWVLAECDDREKRIDWLEQTASPFLSELKAEQLDSIVARVPDLDEKLSLLTILLHRPTRRRLQKAIMNAGEVFAKQAPVVRPQDAEQVAEWGRRLRLLVTLVGFSNTFDSNALAMAKLLGAAPPWLLPELFCSLGLLQQFEGYSFDLAMALPHMDPARVAPSVAEACLPMPSERLVGILRVLARVAGGDLHGLPPGKGLKDLPSSPDVDALLLGIRDSLYFRDSEVARRVWNWIQSSRAHHEELPALFVAYLDARPRLESHELVMDFLSAHRDRESPSISEWGLPSFKVFMRGSMRSNSINVARETVREFEPPDFDPREVFRQLSAGTLKDLASDQTNNPPAKPGGLDM